MHRRSWTGIARRVPSYVVGKLVAACRASSSKPDPPLKPTHSASVSAQMGLALEQDAADDHSGDRSKTNSTHHFPSHWNDDKHEPDGTAKDMIIIGKCVDERRVGTFRTGVNEGAELLRLEMNSIVEKYGGVVDSWDDVTGAALDIRLLREARAVEMAFFDKMGVWAERLPRSAAKARGAKLISGRWVDTNKGDISKPVYQARLVGKEYNTGVDPALYAATPPLEGLKLMLGHSASNAEQVASDAERCEKSICSCSPSTRALRGPARRGCWVPARFRRKIASSVIWNS